MTWTYISFMFAKDGVPLHGGIEGDKYGNLRAFLAPEMDAPHRLNYSVWERVSNTQSLANLRTARAAMLRWARDHGYVCNAEDHTEYMLVGRSGWIADEFTLRMRRYLTRDQWREMVARNAAYAAAGDHAVCASHEFCDANVFMIEAFRAVVGRFAQANSDADADLINKAWGWAKKRWQRAAKP